MAPWPADASPTPDCLVHNAHRIELASKKSIAKGAPP
jgi:hypothetical protein